MQMPERNFSSNKYRYAFNGKENDKDISEGGQDYGMRIYDSRIGKFLSVDPLTKEYPFYTPYQFAGNKPIWAIDLDGMEPVYSDPTAFLYEGCSQITQGIGNLWDKATSFFVSYEKEITVDGTKTKSIGHTSTTTLSGKGSMYKYLNSASTSKSNTMPVLKLSDIYSVELTKEEKVEMKTSLKKGPVEVENKINLNDGSVEVKGTVIVPIKASIVPLKVSTSMSQNNIQKTTNSKIEVSTDTKPISIGGAVEFEKDSKGQSEVKATISGSIEQTKGKVTVKQTLTIGKKF
jgi:RHS repeat-associated protein